MANKTLTTEDILDLALRYRRADDLHGQVVWFVCDLLCICSDELDKMLDNYEK